jgi:phosphatidylinositol alpha-1,6-mannosyltransferase
LILALQTTAFSTIGGIQTYNGLVCRVLNEIERTEREVLLGSDTAADTQKASAELPGLTLRGFDGNRAAFAKHLLHLGLTRRISLCLVGHVNYAPIGLLLKRLQPAMRFGVVLYGVEAWQPLPWLKSRALRQADFFISISEFTRQRAVEANRLNVDKVYLLPNALESIEVINRPTTPPSTKPPSAARTGTTLLSVCRLESSEQYKGVDRVIEVLPDVLGRVPDVEYVVVGGGTDLERHKILAATLGVADRVHFLGFLSDEKLQAQFRECDLFVMPSAAEGFGFVFLEAMRYAKPVLAANSAGTPEVVQDGITGRLVEYGNREQLADTLIGLCLDSAARQRFGQAGYQRLQDRFTYPKFKENLTEILSRELPAGTLHLASQPDDSTPCALVSS